VNRVILCVLVALVATPAATRAQPASAIGHPLPKADLPTGTITVRVIAGSIAAPVVGTDVTLDVGGKPRSARTDSEGRATFADLPPGTTVQAKISDAEGKAVTSDAFPVPAQGGAGVMLTTKPMAGGPMGGPMAGGGGAMMDPRKASGMPRPHPKEPAGSYTVRLTYASVKIESGEPKDPTPPVGEGVTLVGYTSDDTVELVSKKVDADGKATFDNLDPSGNTVYFALATLPRNGGIDRLTSKPVQLDNQSGARVILSGEKRDSTAPAIDDFATPQAMPTPPGKVRVALEFGYSDVTSVSIINAATKQPIAMATGAQISSSVTNIESISAFQPAADIPVGTLKVWIHGVTGGNNSGLAGIKLAVIPADAQGVVEGVAATTGDDGTATLTIPTNAPQRVRYTVKGKEFTSDPFDPSKQGGGFEAVARWQEGREALLDAPPGVVAYAETRIPSGRFLGTYHSLPFVTIPQAGVNVALRIAPRLVLQFKLTGLQDDEDLAVHGQFSIQNLSWSPYRGGDDGTLIPLPKGFQHGILANNQQTDVAIVAGAGVRLTRPLPPGQKAFIAGFSLPIENGKVEWKWDLPFGAFGSDLDFLKAGTPNMAITGAQSPREVKDNDGRDWLVFDQLMIGREQAMVMTIDGLRSPPAWRWWMPRIAGLLVIGLLIGGLAFALVGKSQAPVTSKRRQALLDELVELERTGTDPKRREQVMNELERIWGG
jgi:hypothetical protein